MTKFEFMSELEGLLSDISMDEKTEALRYYENYFEDAGPDREQSIVSELGSPKKVAASIKADLNASEQEVKDRGYFTENGYEDETLREPKYEIIDGTATENDNDNKQNLNYENSKNTGNYNSGNNYDGDNHTNANYGYHSDRSNGENEKAAGNNNSALKVVLIVILCIFAIPVGIPLIATAFGIFIAVIATVASIWLAFAMVSAAMLFTGIIMTVVGIIKLLTLPVIGICLTGGGLILFGIGLLFTMATVGLSTKVLPVLFRGFVNFCRLPFQNRRVAA